MTIRLRVDAPPAEVPPAVVLLGLMLKLMASALPMREVAAVRLSFLDPDVIGALADAMFVQATRSRRLALG